MYRLLSEDELADDGGHDADEAPTERPAQA
jgi:hypothetical protein